VPEPVEGQAKRKLSLNDLPQPDAEVPSPIPILWRSLTQPFLQAMPRWFPMKMKNLKNGVGDCGWPPLLFLSVCLLLISFAGYFVYFVVAFVLWVPKLLLAMLVMAKSASFLSWFYG